VNYLDWIIVFVYAGAMVGIGYYFSGEQKNSKDFFLGARSFGWFPLALSTMATQLSAISFISAPAFVGFRPNGGLQWLTFEFGVPLAMIFLMYVIIPPLYNAGVVSVYAFLEQRFSASTRLLISVAFQISRGFATGISVYALALVLSAVLGIPIWTTILIAGVVTLIYSALGGMKAVVYTDVIQMIILVVGVILCIGFGLSYVGGLGSFVENVDRSRLDAVQFFNFGFGKGEEFGFLPMVVGGFFLYASYYGTDQTQVQRSLSGRNLQQVRQALLVNGFFRFPVTFLYCTMGLIVGTFAVMDRQFFNLIPPNNPDLMIPLFISRYLPNGLIGILIVAILSAAMSSLSSAINSLSATSVEDFIVRRQNRPLEEGALLKYSRSFTLFWGIVCIAFAFAAGNIAATVIEAINKIGSLFYGPILATFALAILTRRANAVGANVGLMTGVAGNFLLWILAGDVVFWFWWNFIGAAVTFSVGLLVSHAGRVKDASVQPLAREATDWRTKETALLFGYFLFLVIFCSSLVLIF